MKSRLLNSSRLTSLSAKMFFTYVSHEIMTPKDAMAAMPSTSNWRLSFHILDSVHRPEMVGHILVVDGQEALLFILALPLTNY